MATPRPIGRDGFFSPPTKSPRAKSGRKKIRFSSALPPGTPAGWVGEPVDILSPPRPGNEVLQLHRASTSPVCEIDTPPVTPEPSVSGRYREEPAPSRRGRRANIALAISIALAATMCIALLLALLSDAARAEMLRRVGVHDDILPLVRQRPQQQLDFVHTNLALPSPPVCRWSWRKLSCAPEFDCQLRLFRRSAFFKPCAMRRN